MNKDRGYEDKRGIKIELVCKCGNECELPNASFPGSSRPSNVIGIFTGIVYICSQCGKEMNRRITQFVSNITETILEEN